MMSTKSKSLGMRKINPLILFGIFVVLLPVLLVAIRGSFQKRAEITFQLIERDWIRLELPGVLLDERSTPAGVRYLTAGEDRCEIVLAMVPAPEGSPAQEAMTQGALPLETLYTQLFSSVDISDLDCTLFSSGHYVVSGRRRSDGWFLCGDMRGDLAKDSLFALMVIAPDEARAEAVRSRMSASFVVKGR